jgi:hypothetical protein
MPFFWICYQFKFVFHLYPSLLTKIIHFFTRVADTANFEHNLSSLLTLVEHLSLASLRSGLLTFFINSSSDKPQNGTQLCHQNISRLVTLSRMTS